MGVNACKKNILALVVAVFYYSSDRQQYSIGFSLLLLVLALGLHTFFMPMTQGRLNVLGMLELLGNISMVFSFTVYFASNIIPGSAIAHIAVVILALPNCMFLGSLAFEVWKQL